MRTINTTVLLSHFRMDPPRFAETYSTNNISCGKLDIYSIRMILTLVSTLGVASVLLCTMAIVLVLVLRLYRSLVYRLAAYQVLAALLYGIVCSFEMYASGYNETNLNVSTPLCKATAFFMIYFVWVKLMFTACVTAHLFFFAVFYRNLKKLEPLYVLSSVLVPVVISVIPFTTGSYGRAGAYCWIQNWKNNCPQNVSDAGVAMQFTVWYGPAFFVLLGDLVAVVVMVTVLVRRALNKSQQHKEVLTQMLPLFAYPVTYILLLVVPIATRVYTALPNNDTTADRTLLALTGACMSLWGLAAGAALLVHICVMKNHKHHSEHVHVKVQYESLTEEATTIEGGTSDAYTFYEAPREDDNGDVIYSNQ